MSSIYIFDPTVRDNLSKVRGIGRYLQILKENFGQLSDVFIFTDNLSIINNQKSAIFINPFFELLKPPLILKRIAKKQIAVIHDLIRLKYPRHFPIGIKGKINIFLNKLVLKNYDSVITDSEQSKKDIINLLNIDEKKIKVIYPTLPHIFLNPKSQFPISKQNQIENFCLYVGDVTWNKNLVNLAKAIKIVNVTCIFVGKQFSARTDSVEEERSDGKTESVNGVGYIHPEQQEFRDFLNEVKDDKKFVFKGFVTDEELIKLYTQAKLNILVSRDEGFGFSYLEAASQKIPSVLSNIPVFKEIAQDSALFANPRDPQDIADQIKKLYTDDNLNKSLGQKAYERSKFFSQEEFRKSFLLFS